MADAYFDAKCRCGMRPSDSGCELVGRVKRTVRLSQSVVPFGVGSIYDIFGESFAACDTSTWGPRGRPISSIALRQQLGVEGLRVAPSIEELYAGVPFVRFPAWLFCQRCRTLFRWSRRDERPDEPAICIACSGVRQLVPMRFVVACERGHLGDVPWHIWAHSGSKSGEVRCKSEVLEFRGRSAGGSGLASLQVLCKKCKTGRSLAGLTTKDSLTRLGIQCLGTQPWQLRAAGESCEADPQVVQRGASNVYFADVVSALEIPTAEGLAKFDELRLKIENHGCFQALRYCFEQTGIKALSQPMGEGLLQAISNDLQVSKAQVIAVLTNDDEEKPDGDHVGREWIALTTPQPIEMDPRASFITRQSALAPDSHAEASTIQSALERVTLVTRLKEIRALRSFCRLDPGNRQLRPDLSSFDDEARIRWVPAIEVYGEGIFLSFQEAVVRPWEGMPAVIKRVKKLQQNLAGSVLGRSIVKQRLGHDTISARFILLHTLAHLLIRELCFECGYSSASLRERIYSRVSPEGAQAGFLIYTAAGDAEGTLGGLVRQGQPPRLLRALMKAIEGARWCSADPICRESDGQGYDDTNLAACHACCLLPETSCVTGNMLLDRSLVIDNSEGGGFFTDMAAAGTLLHV